MLAVIRTYSGERDKKVVDLLEKHESEIRRLIRSINGFVSYSLVRTADGGFSVTVYEEKTGIDKRSRLHEIGLRGTGPLSAAFQRLS
jgi:hypothetical protein